MFHKKTIHHYPVVAAVGVCFLLVALAFSDFFGALGAQTSTVSLTINPGYECYDGQDNDGNGLEDYPSDPGCDSYTDDDESTAVQGGGGGSGVSAVYHPTPTPSSVSTGSSAFYGITIPNTLIRVLQDGIVVETVRSDEDGRFTVMVSLLGDGLHTFSFIAVTDYGTTLPFALPLIRKGNEETETTGIALSPVVAASVTSIARGESLSVFGYAQPASPVQIEVHSDPVFVQTVQSGADGSFEVAFPTDGLAFGEHAIYAKTFINGAWTDLSLPWRFTVGTQTTIAPIVSEVCHADVNGDGRVNIVDLSVLEEWFEKPLSTEMRKTEASCLSGDGEITPIDLSILGYYWTG